MGPNLFWYRLKFVNGWQLAIGTEDVYKTAGACELIGGGKTVTAPGALPRINTKICAITDPDGWKTVLRSPSMHAYLPIHSQVPVI